MLVVDHDWTARSCLQKKPKGKQEKIFTAIGLNDIKLRNLKQARCLKMSQKAQVGHHQLDVQEFKLDVWPKSSSPIQS